MQGVRLPARQHFLLHLIQTTPGSHSTTQRVQAAIPQELKRMGFEANHSTYSFLHVLEQAMKA